jgi:hypothetical protein
VTNTVSGLNKKPPYIITLANSVPLKSYLLACKLVNMKANYITRTKKTKENTEKEETNTKAMYKTIS